jgi:hypothetical protein
MSRDYAALERELIEELETRTGRDLTQWMSAIDDAALPSRNAIIDWLRPQGFSFSRASWLERIHHNGGRPVYEGSRSERRIERPRIETPASPPATLPPPAAAPAIAAVAPSSTQYAPPPTAPRQPAAPVAATANDPHQAPPMIDSDTALAALLPKAKAYRPLAEMLLRELRRVMNGATLAIDGDVITLTRTGHAAALLIGAKELRLALDLGTMSVPAPWVKPKPPLALPHLTHMLALTDARQINADLATLLATAWERAA